MLLHLEKEIKKKCVQNYVHKINIQIMYKKNYVQKQNYE